MISTTASIERTPPRRSFSFIHNGVGAETSIFLITRPTKRGQASGASTRIGKVSFVVTGTALIAGSVNSNLLITATSRATPKMLRQSARFGVMLISIALSSSFKYSRISVPMVASSGNSMMPLWSSEIPSSEYEHNIPSDGSPRNLAALILKSPGNTAPTVATATFKP